MRENHSSSFFLYIRACFETSSKKVQFPIDIVIEIFFCKCVCLTEWRKGKADTRRQKLFDNFYSFYLWFSFLNLMIGLSCSLLRHSLQRHFSYFLPPLFFSLLLLFMIMLAISYLFCFIYIFWLRSSRNVIRTISIHHHRPPLKWFVALQQSVHTYKRTQLKFIA